MSRPSLSIVLFALTTWTGCSTNGSGGDGGIADAAGAMEGGIADGASPSDLAAKGSGADLATATSNNITGMYGTEPIKPIVAAFWIGMPGNPSESGGGPFIYLFSGPVSCADLSQGSGWVTKIPNGTQVLELIVGTTSIGTPVPASAHAAPNMLEANYAFGGSATEARATSGNVALTAYSNGVSADGTVDLTFPSGQAKGSFHAVWCASGNEF
jgi:hypothetical protein